MGKFTKWIAGGLGWALLGPIGGILGFAAGSYFEKSSVKIQDTRSTTPGGFAVTLLILTAAVMKADGKILRSELDYVKNYFRQAFDEESAGEALRMLRDIIKQNIPLNQVCSQIKMSMDYASRIQLMHFLYGIAQADGHIDPAEQKTIDEIGYRIGLSAADTNSVRSMFIKNTDWAYQVLEISPDATETEIKKAYKSMAIKFHPDKVAHLGEDFQNKAKEKFQKIAEAYETIKKEQKIN